MAVFGQNKREQGYPTTTSYASYGNLRDRGFPNNYYDNGSAMTGSKLSGSTTNYGTRSIGSSSGSGSGTRRLSASASTSANNLGNAYNALLAAYQKNDYSDYLAQMRGLAQAAYSRGMNALNDAYNTQMSSLADNLNSTRNQLMDSYNRSRENITDDAENSLKQAYINRKLSERNLGQQMSAMGLSGGATETTLASMNNNYGNARNNIDNETNKNLSSLEGNYNDSLAQALQAYNSAVATANAQKAQQAMALESALANNEMSALGDYQSLMQQENQNYLNLLKTAIDNGASFSYTPTEAGNAVKALAFQQASQPTTNTNYAVLEALMNAQQAPGQNGAAVALTNPTVNNNYLAQILAQLRG